MKNGGVIEPGLDVVASGERIEVGDPFNTLREQMLVRWAREFHRSTMTPTQRTDYDKLMHILGKWRRPACE